MKDQTKGLWFLVKAGFTLVMGFEILRFVLLWRYLNLAETIPASTLIKAFLVGARFDLAISAYIISPVALLGLLPGIGLSYSALSRKIASTYLVILGGFAYILCIVDFEFFGYYNSRLNHQLLSWNDTPSMALGFVWETYPVIPYSLLWLALTGLLFFLLRIYSRQVVIENPPTSHKNYLQQLWIYPLSLALVFLAIRGRVSLKAPLSIGIAYFSKYDFANQLALNSNFTFIRDAVLDKKNRENASKLLNRIPEKEAIALTRQLLSLPGDQYDPNYPFARIEDNGRQKDLNVIVVLMETQASVFINSCNGMENLAPEFDRISREGVLFPEFISNGSHTYTGIFSTVTGLPSIPGKSVMKRVDGQQEYSGLASSLKKRGYTNYFYIPHDPHFDNMQGFLISSGFDKIISQPDFPASEVVSSMGVPDEVLFNRALQDFASQEGPFYAVIMTGSSHGPFIYPERPFKHASEDDPNEKRFNAFAYADWAFGQFYDELKNTQWGQNTLLAALGDHGLVWKPRIDLDLSLFKVPLLLVAPGVVQPGINHKSGNQADLTATVMGILGGKWVNNTIGNNLLADYPDYAILIRNESVGVIKDGYYLTSNQRNGKTILYDYNTLEINADDEVQKRMVRESDALITATNYLISNRMCAAPDLDYVIKK